jgi:hypothetical protein
VSFMHLLWRAFLKIMIQHCNIGRNGKVPMRQTILNWVSQLRSTVSALPKKNPGCP